MTKKEHYKKMHNTIAKKYHVDENMIVLIRSLAGEKLTREQVISFLKKKVEAVNKGVAKNKPHKKRDFYLHCIHFLENAVDDVVFEALNEPFPYADI